MWPMIAVLIPLVLLLFLALSLVSHDQAPDTQPYMSYFEDGLWDLYAGAVLLSLAVAVYLDLSVIAFVPVLLYPVLRAAKRGITAPRLDTAELAPLSPRTRRILLYFALGLAFLLAILALMLLLANLVPQINYFAWLGLAFGTYALDALWLLLVALLAVWGYRTRMPRLVVYAAFLASLVLAAALFDLPLYISALLMGVVVTAGGLVIASDFVHSHPMHRPM